MASEAEAAWRRADQRGDASGRFILGVLLEERGELREAKAAYQRAVDSTTGAEVAAALAREALDRLAG